MDLDMMLRLHKKVNIVLVIGKADCLTQMEVKRLKQRILQDLEDNHVQVRFVYFLNIIIQLEIKMFLSQVYQFPECDSDEDEDFKQQDKELKASIPFAVVGSNTVIEIAGKKVRGRQYPWGVVDGESYY